MELSYILTAIAIVICTAIPYKSFTNWRKNQIRNNLQKLAEKYALTIVEDEDPNVFPKLNGKVNDLFVSIDTTKTSERSSFPVTHITFSRKYISHMETETPSKTETHPDKMAPAESTNNPEITILPNKTFMTTPEERYIKTGNSKLDSLYLIALPHNSKTKEIKQPILNILTDGVSPGLCNCQLIVTKDTIKVSLSEHISSDYSYNLVLFIFDRMPGLYRELL